MEVQYRRRIWKTDLSLIGGRNTRNREMGNPAYPDSPFGNLFFRYNFSDFLTTTLPGKLLLDTFLLTRLQIEGVFFHFLDDVFLLNLSLEAS